MFSTLSIPAPDSQQDVKRVRNKYSRLICLGCRERRIRCELPSDTIIPRSGELQEVQTPCYRCRRLGLRCVIRQTILGRPSVQSSAISAAHLQRATTDRIGPCTKSDIPKDSPQSGGARYWNDGTLMLRQPRSSDAVVIVHAIDTLHCEKVEEEWFRHLPAHYGHTPALDLAVKALVQACAYARGVARVTSTDCFQALMPVLGAVQANLKQSHVQSNDDVLAATALLAPFEGTVKKDGIPSRLHVEGLAAIIAARPKTHPVTQLARDIIDWFAAETSIMACIQGTPSPFEKIPRAYFASDRQNSDRAHLKALGNELFIRTPRLVMMVRTLRLQQSPQYALLLDAYELLQSLLELQNTEVEQRLMQNVTFQLSNGLDATPTLCRSFHFASVKDYEALTCYWQGRLSLLRLQRQLHVLLTSRGVRRMEGSDTPASILPPSLGPQTNETCILVKNLLMSAECAPVLPLFRQQHLLAHAVIVVWGVTMDQSAAMTESLSELLLRRVNRALGAKPEFVAEDMHQAVDVFVGGERRGRLVELYGL